MCSSEETDSKFSLWRICSLLLVARFSGIVRHLFEQYRLGPKSLACLGQGCGVHSLITVEAMLILFFIPFAWKILYMSKYSVLRFLFSPLTYYSLANFRFVSKNSKNPHFNGSNLIGWKITKQIVSQKLSSTTYALTRCLFAAAAVELKVDLSSRGVFVFLRPSDRFYVLKFLIGMIYSWFKLALLKNLVFLSSPLLSISSTYCEFVFKSKLVFLSSKMHTLNTEWGC